MSQTETNNIMLKAIRTSGINKYLDVAKEDLLFEYIACFVDDNEFLLNFLSIINVLKDSKDKLNEDEKLLLEKYEQMVNLLKQKCLDNELDNMERIIYLLLLSNSLINNYRNDFPDIFDYMNNTSDGIIYYSSEEIFLIMAYTLHRLNQEYNNDVFLIFDEDKNEICSYRYYKGRKEIVVGGILIRIINFFANKKNSRYFTLLYYSVLVVMHEFFHSIQFPKGIQNPLSVENTTYRKEGLIALFKTDFYNRFHNNFCFEQDANEFAFTNINDLLLRFMDEKRIKKSRFKVICFKRISEGRLKLNQQEFAKRINQEYESLGGKVEKQLKRSDINGCN